MTLEQKKEFVSELFHSVRSDIDRKLPRVPVCFDYSNQAWVIAGFYIRCGHPERMNCKCYGKIHAGEPADMSRVREENR